MDKSKNGPWTLSIKLCWLGSLAAFYFWPTSLNQSIFVSVDRPMVIKASQGTPPRAIFDDLIIFSDSVKRESRQPIIASQKKEVRLNTESLRPIGSIAHGNVVRLKLERFNRRELAAKGPAVEDPSNIDLSGLNAGQINRLQMARIEKPAETPSTHGAYMRSEWMRGELEFYRGEKGLPFGPGFSIEVRRFLDDMPKEIGKADPIKGEFSIQIPENSGELVARVYNENGLLVAEGRHRLKGNHNPRPKIKIHPRENRFVGAAGDFYSGTGNLFSGLHPAATEGEVYNASLNQVAILSNGKFGFDGVTPGSQQVLRFLPTSEDREPYLYIAQTDEKLNLPVLPKNFVSALKEVIRDLRVRSDYPSNGSIIIGQVLSDGEPVFGARVAAESAANAQVFYLNSLFLPDTSLQGTSEKGYFVILDLPEGMHALQAYHGENLLGVANVISEAEGTSLVGIQALSLQAQTNIKVFDAFSGGAQRALLELQGHPEALDVLGVQELKVSEGDKEAFMIVRPTDARYIETRQVYSHNSEHIHALLVEETWLTRIAGQNKINHIPDTAIVIGFTPKDIVSPFLPHIEGFASENIVYFNPQGQVVSQPHIGGGFILFNVPPGVQSVSALSENEGEVQSYVIPADPYSVTVLKFSF